LSYRFDNGDWRVESTASGAVSKMAKDNRDRGPFQGLTAVLNVPSPRVSFLDFSRGDAGRIEVRNAAGQIVDLDDIRNFRITAAQEIFYDRTDKVWFGEAKVRRRLRVLPVPASIEFGGSTMTKNHDGIEFVRNLTFNGPDGNPATVESAEPYRMQVFSDRGIPWLSPDRAWEAWQSNPALFSQTPLQAVQQENTRRNGSKFIEERIMAGYVQAEANLLANRLKILGGVRYEETTDRGRGVRFDPGAVWVRNANGTFARNAQGARIRRPDAGAVNSMEQLDLTTTERGYTNPLTRAWVGISMRVCDSD